MERLEPVRLLVLPLLNLPPQSEMLKRASRWRLGETCEWIKDARASPVSERRTQLLMSWCLAVSNGFLYSEPELGPMPVGKGLALCLQAGLGSLLSWGCCSSPRASAAARPLCGACHATPVCRLSADRPAASAPSTG